MKEELQGVGVDVDSFIDRLNNIFDWERPTQISTNIPDTTGQGLRQCLNDIKPMIPTNEITLHFASRFLFSPPFRNFVDKLRERNFQNNVAALQSCSEANNLFDTALNVGVDMEAVKDFFNSFLNMITKFVPFKL